MKKIAILGGGGLAKEFIELIELNGHIPYGVFAKESLIDSVPYLGYLNEIIAQKENFDAIALAVGGVNTEGIKNRRSLIDFLRHNNIPIATLISPHATISKSAVIGEGSYIHHLAAISCDATLGAYSLINTGAVVGHDVIIGKNCTVSPKVFLGGNVRVGDDSLIGAGAIVKQGITIGEGCIVGMGTVVQRSMKDHTLLTHNLDRPVPIR